MMNNLPKFLSFITHVLENNFVVEIVVEDDEDAFLWNFENDFEPK